MKNNMYWIVVFFDQDNQYHIVASKDGSINDFGSQDAAVHAVTSINDTAILVMQLQLAPRAVCVTHSDLEQIFDCAKGVKMHKFGSPLFVSTLQCNGDDRFIADKYSKGINLEVLEQ